MNKKVLKRLFNYCKPYILYLYLSLVFALLSVVCSLLLPIVIGDTIDLMIGINKVDFYKIFDKLKLLFIIVIASGLFQWLMSRCSNIITYHTIEDLRNDYFNKLQRLPIRYIDSKMHGDLINRMINDIDLIGEGLLHGFASLLTGVLTIAGTICFMLSINVAVSIVVILMTPISLFVASYIAKKTFSLFQEQLEIRGELGGFVEEHITNLKLVKAFSYEEDTIDKYKEINQRMKENGVKSQFASALINPSTRFINNLVYMAVGIVGALMVVRGKMSVGGLSSFLSYANQYTKPFNEISNVIAELQTALASSARVFDILDQVDEIDEGKDQIDDTRIQGNVKFNHVFFSYNQEKPFIQDLDFNVLKGQKVAIVGPTGCGKTTLINLLMRFYEIDKGTIEVDGIKINDLSRTDLRKHFGMVLQDTWMFKGTVKENISYGNNKASNEDIIDASKRAHSHHFIERLPTGYDTILEENGSNISIGQRQLLCIARIMLSKPEILILDEATSNIDTRTESLIQEGMDELMKGRTSFIVAHRLSTIVNADLILVMKDGEIIEKGTHEALLNEEGFYYDLYNSQFSKEG